MELFKIDKASPLVLELQDPATSDDPLIQYLERRGWTVKLIESVKSSIAEKLTPDLFTRTVKELSAIELSYQSDIDRYYLQLASERM